MIRLLSSILWISHLSSINDSVALNHSFEHKDNILMSFKFKNPEITSTTEWKLVGYSTSSISKETVHVAQFIIDFRIYATKCIDCVARFESESNNISLINKEKEHLFTKYHNILNLSSYFYVYMVTISSCPETRMDLCTEQSLCRREMAMGRRQVTNSLDRVKEFRKLVKANDRESLICFWIQLQTFSEDFWFFDHVSLRNGRHSISLIWWCSDMGRRNLWLLNK